VQIFAERRPLAAAAEGALQISAAGQATAAFARGGFGGNDDEEQGERGG